MVLKILPCLSILYTPSLNYYLAHLAISLKQQVFTVRVNCLFLLSWALTRQLHRMWPVNFPLPGVPSLVLGVDKQPISVRRDRLFLQCCSHMLVSMLLQITLNPSPPIFIIKLKQYRHGGSPSFHSLVLCLEWVGVCSRLLRRSLHNKHLFTRPFKCLFSI